MALRYFKKLSPETAVVLGNNASVKFNTVDQLQGWYATENAYLHSEFERLMRENRYGITETTDEEFKTEYLQKKTIGDVLPPPSREEMFGSRRRVSSPVETMGAEAVAAVVAVSVPAKGLLIALEEEPPANGASSTLSKASAPGDFKPPTGKRKRSARNT